MDQLVQFLTSLAQHLRDSKDQFVHQRAVLERRWDPTYGEQAPSETYIDEVDFDKLLNAIDEFSQTFRKGA